MNSAIQPTLAFWTEDEPLECVSTLPEVPDVVTFTFQSPSGALFAFKPGQFITLELPVPGGPLHRTYTISSSPSRPASLTLTVKAQEASVGTRWMLNHLRPGMRLKASRPSGTFSYLNFPAQKYLFISAGSGITPMMSMTTQIYDEGRDPDIVFVNCAKRPSEIVFRDRMEHMTSRTTVIELAWVVERTDPYHPWTGFRGMMNQLILGLVAPDYLEREVFCCGPEPFMQAVREALYGLGYNMDRYHQESFHALLPDTSDVPDDITPDDTEMAEIEFTTSGKTVKVAQTETLLAAARSAGVLVPSGCTFGICGTCKVKKAAGDVHMVHNGGITDDEIDAGYILACCSNPIGKVKIEA